MSGHVFLSYAHATDGPYVRRLAEHLASAGVPVWYDREIVSGDRWEQVIRDRIDSCAAFVVVMTPAADESSWVKREIARAEHAGRPIFPLLLAGREFFRLADLQFEDVTGGRLPSAPLIERLRAAVGGVGVEVPRPAEQRGTARMLHVLTDGLRSGTASAWSSRGRVAVKDSEDAICVFDPDAGTCLRRFPQDVYLQALAFTPDGEQLAVTSDLRGTVRVWSVESGEVRFALPVHGKVVYALAFSPDGTRLATACADGLVRLWDARTGAAVATLAGHGRAAIALAYSPAGKYLATGSRDHTVRIWSADGEHRLTLTGHTDSAYDLAWSVNERHLASAGIEGRVRLWDVGDGSTRHIFPDTGGNVRFSADGARLLTIGRQRDAHLWDPTDGSLTHRLTDHAGKVNHAAFSPDGRHLVTASEDGTARVWTTDRGRALYTLASDSGPVLRADFSPNGQLILMTTAQATTIWESPSRVSRRHVDEMTRDPGTRSAVPSSGFLPGVDRTDT